MSDFPNDKIQKFRNTLSGTFSLIGQLDAVTEAANEGGLKGAEAEKLRRKLEGENEEIVTALEDAEIALEQEKQKFLKMQMEFAQYRQV